MAGTVPSNISKTLKVRTVPPNYKLVRSTRKEKSVCGVEPTGENRKLWKSLHEMLTMFEKVKLLRSTVPPNPQAGAKIKNEHLLRSEVPPSLPAGTLILK